MTTILNSKELLPIIKLIATLRPNFTLKVNDNKLRISIMDKSNIMMLQHEQTVTSTEDVEVVVATKDILSVCNKFKEDFEIQLVENRLVVKNDKKEYAILTYDGEAGDWYDKPLKVDMMSHEIPATKWVELLDDVDDLENSVTLTNKDNSLVASAGGMTESKYKHELATTDNTQEYSSSFSISQLKRTKIYFKNGSLKLLFANGSPLVLQDDTTTFVLAPTVKND